MDAMGRWTKPIALGIAATVGALCGRLCEDLARSRIPDRPRGAAPAQVPQRVSISSGVSLLVGLGTLNSNVNDRTSPTAPPSSRRESVVEIPVPVGGTVSHLRVNVTKARSRHKLDAHS